MKKAFLLFGLVLLSVMLCAQDHGGPDNFGYRWATSDNANGPTYNWITPSTNSTALTMGDDDIQGPFDLGFTFNFYGVDYTSVKISSNGYLTFNFNEAETLVHQDVPDANTPNNLVGWFWSDIDPPEDNLSTISYETITFNNQNAFVVTFDHCREYNLDTPGYFTGQVVLVEDGKILIQYEGFYEDFLLSSQTVGLENSDGTDGIMCNHNDSLFFSNNMAIEFAVSDIGANNPVPANGSIGVLVDGDLSCDFLSNSVSYDLWFGPEGNMAQVVTNQPVSSFSPYSYTGLTPLTTYSWRVDVYDSASNMYEGEVWNFETMCGTITTFPWNESFDADNLPSCWVDDPANSDPWSIGASTSSSGTGPQSGDHTSGSGNFIYTEASGHNNQLYKISSPVFNVTGLTSPSLEFYYHMYGGDMGTLQVNIYEPVNDVRYTDVVNPVSGDQGDVWNLMSIDLSTYSEDFVVEIIGTTGDGFESDICIDDISIYDVNTAPGCTNFISPVDAAVDIIENSTLTWSAAQGATGYIVNLGTDNPPTDVVSSQDVGNNLTFDFTGLALGTVYYWQIIPYNASGSATGCPVWSFTSRPDPLVSTFPYSRGFESGQLPVNWIDDPANTTPWSYGTTTPTTTTGPENGDHTTGSGYFAFTESNSNLNQQFKMITNPFDVSSLTNPTMQLWYNMNGCSMGSLQVNIVNNVTGAITADVITPITGDHRDVWFNILVDLSTFTTDPFYFEIVATTGNDYFSDISIDDFSVFDNNVVPQCSIFRSPLDTESDIPECSTLKWDGKHGATGYNVSLGTDNPPTNVVNNLDVGAVFEYDFSGLANNTTYYWSVTPYNDAGTATGCPVWSFTVRSDMTIDVFPMMEDFTNWPVDGWVLDGRRAWSLSASYNVPYCNFWSWNGGNAELITPPLALTGTADLVFSWSHHYNTTYIGDELNVSVSTDMHNWTSVWNRIDDTFESNDGADDTSPGSFIQETVNLDAFAGQTIYVKFDAISGYGPDLFIDNIGVNITTPPDHDLSVITATGPLEVMVGVQSDYTITIRNNGLNPESNYDVKLMMATDVELASTPGTLIQPDSIATFVLSWTPTNDQLGNQQIYGKVVMTGDMVTGNNESAPLSVVVQPSQTGLQGHVYDHNDAPLFNAQILIEELQSVQYTDNNGYYQFANITPGSYTVTASQTMYHDVSVSNVSIVQNVFTTQDFSLGQGNGGPVLQGIVQDHNNAVVNGATVEVAGANMTTQTDDQGRYYFFLITQGSYTVTAMKDGYMNHVVQNLNIVDGSQTQDFVINEYGHIAVQVTTNLNSFDGAVVEATDGTNTYQNTVNDSGWVFFNEVEPGTYDISASLEGTVPYEETGVQVAYGSDLTYQAALNELMLAPTNIQWNSNGGYLSWNHGDRSYAVRTDGESTLADGKGYTNRDSDDGTPERSLLYFRVEIDVLNQTTTDTFFVVSGFDPNETLTATITAVYETGNMAAPDFEFDFIVGNDDEDNVPLVTELKGNYPNPFNPTTNIEFSLKKTGRVELVIYNITGQKVRTLISAEMKADHHRITWNGKDDRGNAVSSGTYFYRLQTSEYTQTKKMLMLK